MPKAKRQTPVQQASDNKVSSVTSLSQDGLMGTQLSAPTQGSRMKLTTFPHPFPPTWHRSAKCDKQIKHNILKKTTKRLLDHKKGSSAAWKIQNAKHLVLLLKLNRFGKKEQIYEYKPWKKGGEQNLWEYANLNPEGSQACRRFIPSLNRWLKEPPQYPTVSSTPPSPPPHTWASSAIFFAYK